MEFPRAVSPGSKDRQFADGPFYGRSRGDSVEWREPKRKGCDWTMIRSETAFAYLCVATACVGWALSPVFSRDFRRIRP